jgi:prepilin-type N-terminal cleavage/methylation domain-containing protein
VVNAQAPGSRSRLRTSDSRRAVAPSQRVGVRISKGYTLLELLTVITIMGLIAALAAPTLRALKPNAKVAATRDLLDAVGRARQLAISQRTTVYMVFLYTNFPSLLNVSSVTNSWNVNDHNAATSLLDKQLVGYSYVSLRSVGDQPGMHTARYLSSWRTLPQGAYIPQGKFRLGLTLTNTTLGATLTIPTFSTTNGIPFPLETTLSPSGSRAYIPMPYIAFDGTGQLVSGVPGQPELIPVSEGIVSFARDANTKAPLAQPAQAREVPVGNTVENYSLVYIDRLTGRAHVERRKVQ